MKGKVYLVGAGPGDPELLTLKAVRVLRQADAVLHDDLVSPEILSLAPKKTLLHDVGKRCGRKSTHQDEIHFLMIELARQGLQVVRLKGGDPFIFGRAGEEIQALRRAGIECEIVPGVTAAFAAAAAAEVPLTLRQTASSLLIMTGQFADDRPLPDLRSILSSGTTIALYMPGADPCLTVRKLVAAGVARQTPCALVSRASTPTQQMTLTTLRELPSVRESGKPSILIVGNVVRLSRLNLLEMQAISTSVPAHATIRVARSGSDALENGEVSHG